MVNWQFHGEEDKGYTPPPPDLGDYPIPSILNIQYPSIKNNFINT